MSKDARIRKLLLQVNKLDGKQCKKRHYEQVVETLLDMYYRGETDYKINPAIVKFKKLKSRQHGHKALALKAKYWVRQQTGYYDKNAEV